MGQAKRQMEEQEDALNSVLGRLAEAGAVSECENHGYMVDNGDSAAVEQVKSDLAEELGEDEADKVVEEALQQVGDECPGCAKNAMDD